MNASILLRTEQALLGVSSRTLARRTGLDESLLSRLLHGQRPLSPERTRQLIDALHADLVSAPTRPPATG